MERTREYFRSLISQRGIKQTFFDGDPKYNASWDYNVSPDKRHFFSVCAEGPIIDAMVYEYIPETCGMIKCIDTKTDIITYPRTVRPSKVHTCMSFMEDGRIIMNNHTTAMSPYHPDWMPEAYYSHPWEGFPGSNVFVYDPKTGKTEDYGIPVPRESIYGGAYDPVHRAYYFTGYMRGHGYRLDMDDRKVTDYGQLTECSVYYHYLGPDGNIYFSTRRGRMMRFNTAEQTAEDTGVDIPVDPKLPESRCHNSFAFGCTAPDKRIFLATHRSGHIFAYDCYLNELEDYGSFVPAWYREQYEDTAMIFGMGFDSRGVLWYAVKLLGNCLRLVSWDVFGGGEPQDYGIIGTKEHAVWNFSMVHIVDDIFYGSSTNHAVDGPAMVAIDLQVMREDRELPRERVWDKICYRGTPDADLYPGDEVLTGEAAKDATSQKVVQDIRGGHAFSDGILRQRPRNNQFALTAGQYYVVKLWQHVGMEHSQVQEVSHDEKGNTVVICGSEPKRDCYGMIEEQEDFRGKYYRFVIHRGEVLSCRETAYTPKDHRDMAEKYKDCILPTPAGRSWLEVATCEARLADGSVLVGSRSGGLALVRKGSRGCGEMPGADPGRGPGRDGDKDFSQIFSQAEDKVFSQAEDKVFSLGMVTCSGPIRAMTASPDRRTVYGVAGDPDDMGLVFSYNMDTGLVLHGSIFFEEGDGPDGLGNSCEPCAIDYAPDGMSLAIGVRDRLGCAYEYYFEE